MNLLGNTFAFAMLYLWPLVTVVLFLRLSVPMAAAVSIIAGYLLLPSRTAIDFPMVPPYTKDAAAALPVIIMAAVMSRQAAPRQRANAAPPPHMLSGWLPREPVARICIFAIIAGTFMTSITNSDTLHFGGRTVQALGLYDALSSVTLSILALLPLLIARKFLAHPREQKMLLWLLCGAGLAYSLPALYEVRMSPQLNVQFYGFFPHDWKQHLRGGFRPVVFLEHGLRLGIFLAVCLLATLGYTRTQPAAKRTLYWGAAVWLLLTLALSKNTGALLIGCVLAPVIMFLGVRLQILAAAIVVGIVLLYPMTRGAGIFPTGALISAVSSVAEPGRVASLETRFHHEDLLLERANGRPLFGWGGYGRNEVFDDEGRDITTTDGAWIIVFGQSGWIGYLARFGLLAFPVLLLFFRRRSDLDIATSALCLALAANLTDLIPNSGLTPITWLMAGALTGRLELKRIESSQPAGEAEAAQGSPPSYRRDFQKDASTPGPQEAPVLRRRFDKQSYDHRRPASHRGS